jgi:hypothetical protein
MNVQFKDLDIALNSESYFDHVFNGLIIKRRFWTYPVFFMVIPIIFYYFFPLLAFSTKITPQLFIFPLTIYSAIALFISFVERKILTGFTTSTKEMKIKKLKRFFFYTGTFYTFAFTLIVSNYRYLSGTWYISWFVLIIFLVMFLLSMFFSFYHNYYYKASSEIERKGVLLDDFSPQLNSIIS